MKTIALALAAGLLIAPATLFAQGPPPPPPGYAQGPGGWDRPPDRYTRDLERNAYADGINGARRDLENRRRPNVNNRDEYRKYRGPEPRIYRAAFRDGYQSFWSHQGPPPRY